MCEFIVAVYLFICLFGYQLIDYQVFKRKQQLFILFTLLFTFYSICCVSMSYNINKFVSLFIGVYSVCLIN